jgi:glutamine amidotransferase PdxT
VFADHKKTFSELQAELERNFYHNQSISFKDSVDFVAKRVSSNLTRVFKR